MGGHVGGLLWVTGLMRCGKSCRLRWINYLRPDVKRGNFSKEEEDTIISLHNSIGNKWSRIAAHLPGRTDNEIKNVWNTYLKKRQSKPPTSHNSSSSSSSSTVDKLNNAPPLTPSFTPQLLPPPSTHNTLLDSSTSTISSVSAQEYGSVSNFDPDPYPGESLFDLLGPGLENMLEEVDKPNFSVENKAAMGMEVPLELDYDFWNLFDNLEPTPQRVDAVEETDACGVNLWGEETQLPGEIAEENRNWLRRLEKELGLEVGEEDSSFPSDNL